MDPVAFSLIYMQFGYKSTHISNRSGNHSDEKKL